MNVLIIDNYDSFTFNLYQYCGEILANTDQKFRLDVIRNDALILKEIIKKTYDKIIISPGPGNPSDPSYFGVCSDVLIHLGKTHPILGVCLGMQGMAYCYGGNVIPAKLPMHGKTSLIKHDGKGIFAGIPQYIEGMRYHSLIVDAETLPDCFEITAISKDTKEIMGLRHKTYPLEGIQFHPESFATEGGTLLLTNFLYSK